MTQLWSTHRGPDAAGCQPSCGPRTGHCAAARAPRSHRGHGAPRSDQLHWGVVIVYCGIIIYISIHISISCKHSLPINTAIVVAPSRINTARDQNKIVFLRVFPFTSMPRLICSFLKFEKIDNLYILCSLCLTCEHPSH